MTSTQPKTRYHVIVPDSAGQAALVSISNNRADLPAWTSVEQHFWQETTAVNAGVRRLLGLRVATARACRLEWTDRRRDSYYLVEPLDDTWRPPPGTAWIDRDAVQRLHWTDSLDRDVMLEWLDDSPAPTRAPWYRPGWFATSSCWIREALAGAELTPVGEVEQLRSWERSSIMRLATDRGRVYFKSSGGGWRHEAALTAYLAGRFPEVMPRLVAVDADKGWMLLHEFEGQPLSESGDVEHWIAAYAAHGRSQRALVGAVPELRQLGVPWRGLDLIGQEIPAILADGRRMRAGLDGGLSADEIATLREAGPALRAACARLAAGPIPISLDHGDFWPGNAFVSSTRVTLFDWSDATLSHPFFSLVMAVDEIEAELPGVASRVLDAYLNEWRDFGSLDQLRRVFADAMLVAPLHQALMYRNYYLPAMEFPAELDRMTPHFLRWLVRRVCRL